MRWTQPPIPAVTANPPLLLLSTDSRPLVVHNSSQGMLPTTWKKVGAGLNRTPTELLRAYSHLLKWFRLSDAASLRGTSAISQAPHAYAKIVQRIKDCLSEVKRIPVEVLILEPSEQSSSPLAAVRTGLRNELRGSGYAAYFSEDSCDTGHPTPFVAAACLSAGVRLSRIAAFQGRRSMPAFPSRINTWHCYWGGARAQSPCGAAAWQIK